MTNDVINVGLYGGKGIFGGREKPLEASVISCDKYKQCSFYQNNQCLAVRAPFGDGCKFGSTSTIRGYTSRAMKYGEFKRKWREHEHYNKLSHPPNKLGVIGDQVVFPYPYVRIKETEHGRIEIEDPGFGNSSSYIDQDKFTADLIYRICAFRPQAMMGGEIRNYQKKTVPLFLAHLEEVLPKKYESFIKAYPKFAKKIDYVGRKALLKTIKPSMVYKKSDSYPDINSEWYWDGEFLTYKGGYVSSFSVITDYEIEQIKLKPSDKTFVNITNNDQVDKNTIFID